MKICKLKTQSLVVLLAISTSSLLISCNGSGGNNNNNMHSQTLTPLKAQAENTQVEPEYLYAADYHTNQIHVYNIMPSENNQITINKITDVSTAKGPYAITRSPDGAYLYVTCRNNNNKEIQIFEIIANTGKLKYIDKMGTNNQIPDKMVISSINRAVISTDNGKLYTNTYIPDTHLFYDSTATNTNINEPGFDSTDLLIDKETGRYVFEGHNTSVGLSAYFIDDNNLVPLSINENIDNVYALAINGSDLYALSNNELKHYTVQFTRSDSTINALDSISVGSGSSDVVSSIEGKYIYVANPNNSTIYIYSLGSDGKLHQEDKTYNTTADDLQHPGLLKLNDSGSILYVAETTGNNWDQSNYNFHINVYSIQSDGTLKLLNNSIQGSASTTTDMISVSHHSINKCSDIESGAACVIFISKNQYYGNLGGTQGANDICNQEAQHSKNTVIANYVKQGIMFKALLGWNSATVIGQTYYRPKTENNSEIIKIATATSDYLTSSLDNAIESGNVNKQFWSSISQGIQKNGNDDDHCKNWTSSAGKGTPVEKAIPSRNIGYTSSDGTYKGFKSYANLSGIDWDNNQSGAYCNEQDYVACVAQ